MRFTPALLLASWAALSGAAPTPIEVGPDDIVLYGNGRITMMKRSDLEELEAARKSDVVPPKPSYLDQPMHTFSSNETNHATNHTLTKRAGQSVIIPNPRSRFLGWDVLMSTVAKGAPEGTTVSVTSGSSIANSITVGVSATFKLVEEFLDVSTKIDYGQTWTSTQSQQFSGKVPEGRFGAFVSNPWTNRESGDVWEGTIGGSGSLSYYRADSFDSRNFGGMDWVDGTISLCLGDDLPLKRCLGDGTL